MSFHSYIQAREVAKKLATGKSQQLTFAKKFIAGLVLAYYPSITSRPPITPSKHLLAKEMGDIARNLDEDLASYLIGTTYTVMLPDKYRSKYGVYYTPPSLTQRLLDQAERNGVNWMDAKVLDPACGGGAFLAPIAKRMSNSLKDLSRSNRIKHIEARLSGFEIDPFSAWMSQVFVEIALKDDLNKLRRPLKQLVTICNSLDSSEAHYGQYDLVVGNPPYGKVKLLSEERAKWDRSLYGHANLYGIFADLATRLVSQNGIIAYVTPTSFLGGQYFQALRSLLATEAHPTAFDFIAHREGVFANVLQETLLSVYKKQTRRRLVSVSYLSVKEAGDLKVRQSGRYNIPVTPELPWLFPRSPEQSDLAHAIQQMPYRLSDLGYTVSTGPLVWNRHKNKLHNTKVTGCIPLIWAECVDSTGAGVFTFKAMLRNHKLWFKPNKKDGANIVSEACVLLQRTTSLEQARRLIAAELPLSFIQNHGGEVTIENHLNMIRPSKDAIPVVSPSIITVLMNSDIVDQVFRCINGSTAVSAYELKSMPLPSPNDLQRLEELIVRNTRRATIENAIREMYFNVRNIAAA